MKKLVAFAAVIAAVSFASCGNKSAESTESVAGDEPGMYQTGGGSVQSCISLQSGEKDIFNAYGRRFSGGRT